MQVQGLIADIDKLLPQSPFVRPGGSLLIMVGLPGAGKSYVAEHLQQKLPSVIITTDQVRSLVRARPNYTAAEMATIYELCYGLVNRRLAQGQRVIFDGSNYLASRRQRLLESAARHKSIVAVCQVQASEAVTRQRLLQRAAGERRSGDLSDAGWSVYKWMVEAQEPIAVPHLILDTSATPPGSLALQLCEYWLAQEQTQVPGETVYE